MNKTLVQKYTKKLNLLYIEDDNAISKNILETLRLFFDKVFFASDGEDGLKLFKEHKDIIDIILVDIHLPKIHGIELINIFLELKPKQHICVLSAQDDSSYLRQLIELGVDSFLLKPCKDDQLMQTLYKVSKNIYNQKLLDKYYKNIEKTNKFLEKKLNFTLKTNILTGLKNRDVLIEDLYKRDFTMLALIDIDHIRFINDIHGDRVGDALIKKFASFLKEEVTKQNYYLYQTSFDEFAICSSEVEQDRFEKFIKYLNKKTTNYLVYIDSIDEEISIDATIGVTYELCSMKNWGLTYENSLLLVQANTALKYAKKHNLSLVTYSESINTLQDIQNILEWKDKIKHAYENNDIVAVFQPIVDKDSNILKYETLMRLRVKDGDNQKLITPYHFMDTAIITKQYAKLSEAIIKQALEKLKENKKITLSINLTYSDVENPKTIELLESYLKDSNLGQRLVVEIVESEDIKDDRVLVEFLEKVKKYGVKVAIDDFGSGFSNFENIIKYGTDYIKIDGSLIKKIDIDKNSYAIVKAICEFAHALGIKVIAEFVHSKEILDVLDGLKVDEFQGFYFYEPSLEFINR